MFSLGLEVPLHSRRHSPLTHLRWYIPQKSASAHWHLNSHDILCVDIASSSTAPPSLPTALGKSNWRIPTRRRRSTASAKQRQPNGQGCHRRKAPTGMRRRDIIPWWSKAAQKAEVFGLDFKIFKDLWYWCWFGKARKKKQTRICGKFGISQRILQKGTSASESEVLLLVKIRLSIFMLSFLSWLVLGRKVGRLLRAQEACKKRVSVNKLESHYQIKRQMIVLCFGCPCPSPINQVLGQNKKKKMVSPLINSVTANTMNYSKPGSDVQWFVWITWKWSCCNDLLQAFGAWIMLLKSSRLGYHIMLKWSEPSNGKHMEENKWKICKFFIPIKSCLEFQS